MSSSIFNFPNKIIFSVGTINTLTEQLSTFSLHKVLLVRIYVRSFSFGFSVGSVG